MTKTLKNPIIKPNNPPLPKKKVVKAKKKRERKKDGRKLLFKTKEALQKEIDEYFESCYEMQWKDRDWRDEKGNRVKEGDTWKKEPYQVKVMIQVPTISGLAVALDTSRQTLINYEEREEFFDTIKRAKQFIESIVEEGALNGKLNPTSSIFNLKNNFDWKDKTENDTTFKGNVTLVDGLLNLSKVKQKEEN